MPHERRDEKGPEWVARAVLAGVSAITLTAIALSVVALTTMGWGAPVASAQAPEAPVALGVTVPEGPSLLGWAGEATDSRAILASNPDLATLWWFDPEPDAWIADSASLPPALRNTIAVSAGTGLFVVAGARTTVWMPLVRPTLDNACPDNPSPTDPDDPRMAIEVPRAGGVVSNPVLVSGLAATFEATVQLRVRDASGAVLGEAVTTAAEAFTLTPFAAELAYDVETARLGCVEAFETSAMDGSEINLVQTPVLLTP